MATNWIPTSDICGPEAVQTYESLPSKQHEIAVECSFTGGNHVSLKFGETSQGVAYVFVDDSQDGAWLMTSVRAEAQSLFQKWVDFLCMRQSFVNSDPHSTDHFDIVPPDTEELVLLLNKQFGTNLELTM